MKKIILILMIAILSIVLVACGNNESADTQTTNEGEDVTVIKFFHRWPNEPRNTFYNNLVADFEAENPGVKVQVDRVLNDSYKEKIRVLVSGEDVPDVFSSWSDSFAENIVSSGKVKDISYFFEEDKELSESIMKSQLKAFTFDDKVYGLPLTIDGKAFFYNKEIFNEKGIEIPETFEELVEILGKLKNAGYDNPLIEGLSDPWTISHYMGTINQRLMDPAVLSKDYNIETAEFTNPDYIKALEHFKTLTDYMGEIATAIDHETARNMFANGEVPIMYLQLAEIHMIENAEKIDFGFFNFPQFKDGKGNPNALTGAPEGFMLSKNAPKEAEDFLKFIVSKEKAFEFTKECGQLNAIRGAVTSENASERYMGAYDVILNADETAPWFDNAVDISIADVFMRGGQSMAIGEITPEEIMERVQNEVSKLK